VKKSNTINLTKGLLYTVLALFLVGTMINCGGSSSGPAQVQAPKALIQDYISKHGIMVDASLVDIYVTDEQPRVAATVKRIIDEKKSTGELEDLQHATFDFSNLQIAVVGEKEETAGTVAVRTNKDGKLKFGIKVEDLITKIKENVEKK
jgi:hypothetical protein